MASQSVSNWLKLNILLDQAQAVLQGLFLRSWKARFGQEWDLNCPGILLGFEQFQILHPVQRKTIQEVEVDKWDLTVLKAVMTAKGLFCLPTGQVERIVQIVGIRNMVAHFPNKVIPEKQFNELWDEIKQILVGFEVRDSDLEQLKQGHILGGVEFVSAEEDVVEVNCTEAAKLKEKGNELLKNGDYLAAIQVYSKGLNLPGLRDVDRATLYSNRCAAYLRFYHSKHEQNLLHKGKEDARKAIELRPEWWRGHFRLGKIYAAEEKFEKAELCFNKALAREPQSQEVIDALSDARRQHKLHTVMDYMDAGNVVISWMDFLRDYGKATGDDVESVMKKVSLIYDDSNDKILQNCLLGYQYREGLDGYPRNAQLAAEHYRIAADGGNAVGMFNLATMLLNGEGVEKDFVSAVKLLRKAAAQPPVFRQSNLENSGVKEAEHELGLCYETGIGVSKDIIKAMYWYKRSSNHGCSNATNQLGLLYANGVMNLQPDLGRAEQFFKLAVKSQWALNPNSYAMFNLAHLYETKGDYKKAFIWCYRAKENGNIHPKLDKLTNILNEKMQHFANSGVVEWEEQNNITCAGLTVRERQERFLRATNPIFPLVAENYQRLANQQPTCSPGNFFTKSKFDIEQLKKYQAYSGYGKSLWEAKIHISAALNLWLIKAKDLKNLDLDVCEVFFHHFSAAAEIASIVIQIPHSENEKIILIATRLLERKTAFDRDVRVCYVVCQAFYSPELTVQLLSCCLQLYPQDCFFLQLRSCMHAFSKCYEDGMHDINLAVKLEPNNYEYLQIKAAMMTKLFPAIPARAAIDAHKEFLALAPEDHRFYPDAYYHIAFLLEKDTDKVKLYYELGLAAEKKQLSFFLPYESDYKIIVELKLTVKTPGLTSKTNSSATPKFQPPTYNAESVEPTCDNFCRKLSDPNRIMLIKRHRKCMGGPSAEPFGLISISYPPARVQPAPQSLLGLKAISLEDMDPNKDHVYEGYVLSVTVIDEPRFTTKYIDLLLEDVNGDVERCCVYVHMETKLKAREMFSPGCKMSIVNPYFRRAADGLSIIRVDEPSTLIIKGYVRNICRYCTKPEAAMRCARCKKALYCGKNCQSLDWRRLKHNLICVDEKNAAREPLFEMFACTVISNHSKVGNQLY